MESISQSYRLPSRRFALVLGVMGVGLTVYNALFSTPYYIMLSAASLLFIALPFAFEKVLGLKPDYLLHFTIYSYSFLTFMVGMVFNGYSRIPYYDKAMHTITGLVFGLCGMIFYYMLKPQRRLDKEECPIVCLFSVSFAMLIAVLWEILEYVLNFILHNDAQKVAATGVNDTMLDIIVCLIGALVLCVPIVQYYHKSKTGFFMKLFQSFYDTNLT